MHLTIQLLRLGYKVGTIDVDASQGTLTRYLENRKTHALPKNPALPMPDHCSLFKSQAASMAQAQEEERTALQDVLKTHENKDFIVIDTPGSDAFLTGFAHSFADTLITPLNDSFIDLDLLVRLNLDQKASMRPSTYAEMVWEQKKQRLLRDKKQMDWIVVRNRLAHIAAKNKLEMEKILPVLGGRLGFRLAPGFSERVIFRELFLSGLTLLDMEEIGRSLTMSHISARQELRELLAMIHLPPLEEKRALAS